MSILRCLELRHPSLPSDMELLVLRSSDSSTHTGSLPGSPAYRHQIKELVYHRGHVSQYMCGVCVCLCVYVFLSCWFYSSEESWLIQLDWVIDVPVTSKLTQLQLPFEYRVPPRTKGSPTHPLLPHTHRRQGNPVGRLTSAAEDNWAPFIFLVILAMSSPIPVSKLEFLETISTASSWMGSLTFHFFTRLFNPFLFHASLRVPHQLC